MTTMHSAIVAIDENKVLVLGKTYGRVRLPPSAWCPTPKISTTVIPKHAPISVQYCWPPSGGAAGEKSDHLGSTQGCRHGIGTPIHLNQMRKIGNNVSLDAFRSKVLKANAIGIPSYLGFDYGIHSAQMEGQIQPQDLLYL